MGATAGLAMSAAGAGFSAAGSMKAGKYAKEVGEYNAAVANLQANDALARGEEAERRHRMQVRQLVGAQRASFAAQGVDVNDPDSSALDVQADAAALGELDALTIRQNAAREAWGYRAQAQDARIRGQIGYAEGTNKAVGTILGTAGNLALMKYGFTSKPRGHNIG